MSLSQETIDFLKAQLCVAGIFNSEEVIFSKKIMILKAFLIVYPCVEGHFGCYNNVDIVTTKSPMISKEPNVV